MLTLSELLIAHHDLTSFEELKELIAARIDAGERFLSLDVRPPFSDTPEDWEDRLESFFTARRP